MNTLLSLRIVRRLCWAACLFPHWLHAAELHVEPIETGARVTIDGKPFAEYVTKSGHQPIVWPIVGPNGQTVTATEPADHLHHRSLWFNHGAVNGCDFWREPPVDGGPEENNQIEHREFAEMTTADGVARIVTRNDWVSGGMKLCEDVRTIKFGADERTRWIDVDVELATSEGPVDFGDTKEGSFGLRVAETMAVDSKQGGEIINSRGERNEAAWGRNAEWVDYRGPVDGKPAGIAVFDLPGSFRHPCKWHVRTYGLFAANPFGQHDFPPGGAEQGAYTLPKGETLRLHYRVLFHNGELTPAEIEAAYQAAADETEAAEER